MNSKKEKCLVENCDGVVKYYADILREHKLCEFHIKSQTLPSNLLCKTCSKIISICLNLKYQEIELYDKKLEQIKNEIEIPNKSFKTDSPYAFSNFTYKTFSIKKTNDPYGKNKSCEFPSCENKKFATVCGNHYFCSAHLKTERCYQCKCRKCKNQNCYINNCGPLCLKDCYKSRTCCYVCCKDSKNYFYDCKHYLCDEHFSKSQLCVCRKCAYCGSSQVKKRNCNHLVCEKCEINNICRKCSEGICKNCHKYLNVFSYICRHKYCENCWEENHKICLFCSGLCLKCKFKKMSPYSCTIHPKCSDCEIQIKKQECNHKICLDCNPSGECILCKCSFCKKNKADRDLFCGHRYCSSCISNNFCILCLCSKCGEAKVTKIIYSCYHKFCDKCNPGNLCNLCNVSKCDFCHMKSFNKSSCGHKLCEKCSTFENCGACIVWKEKYDSKCPSCEKTECEKLKRKCNHLGCSKCYNKPCLKCHPELLCEKCKKNLKHTSCIHNHCFDCINLLKKCNCINLLKKCNCISKNKPNSTHEWAKLFFARCDWCGTERISKKNQSCGKHFYCKYCYYPYECCLCRPEIFCKTCYMHNYDDKLCEHQNCDKCIISKKASCGCFCNKCDKQGHINLCDCECKSNKRFDDSSDQYSATDCKIIKESCSNINYVKSDISFSCHKLAKCIYCNKSECPYNLCSHQACKACLQEKLCLKCICNKCNFVKSQINECLRCHRFCKECEVNSSCGICFELECSLCKKTNLLKSNRLEKCKHVLCTICDKSQYCEQCNNKTKEVKSNIFHIIFRNIYTSIVEVGRLFLLVIQMIKRLIH